MELRYNAFAAGVEDPIIVINSGAIDLLTYEELLFIIGHEVGHIKSQHVLYSQMAQILPILGDIIGSATLWNRKSCINWNSGGNFELESYE